VVGSPDETEPRDDVSGVFVGCNYRAWPLPRKNAVAGGERFNRALAIRCCYLSAGDETAVVVEPFRRVVTDSAARGDIVPEHLQLVPELWNLRRRQLAGLDGCDEVLDQLPLPLWRECDRLNAAAAE